MVIWKNKFKLGAFLGTVIFLLAAFFISSATQAKYTVVPQGVSVIDEYKQALEATDINLPQWGLHNLDYIAQGLTRMMVGVPVLDGEQANGGAVGVLAGLIGGMYQNQPISSGQYLADLGRRMEIIKPVYAQGQGWDFLLPILKIWRAIRDIAYLFFIVIFVAIGLMIMFRTKLDPQTVVSVQTALPKIIVSLILVTFSYAICGLIIDLVFLANSLLSAIFTPILVTSTSTYRVNIDVWSVAASLMGSMIKPLGPVPILAELGAIFAAIGRAFTGQFADIINLVLAFTIISTVFKIILSLLGRYVMILLYAVFSPLIFLWGTVPGQNDHISKFLKSLVGAAIIFPTMILLLNFADYFFKATFAPPLQVLQPLDIPGAGPAPHIAAILPGLIGLGILMAASRLPETIDDALSVKAGIAPTLGAEAGGALRRIPIIGSFLG